MYSANQIQAFLEDAKDHPEDDTPRLVLADWLDDHGDPARAEFVRLQCRLARLPEGDPEEPALRRLERELLASGRSTWLPRFGRDHLPYGWHGGEFERGLAAVQPSGTDFLTGPAAAPPEWAWTYRATFYSLPARQSEALLRSPALATLNELRLVSCQASDKDIQYLAHEGAVDRLRSLEIPGFSLTRHALTALATGEKLEGLEHLKLDGLGSGRDLEVLAQGELLGRLRSLALTHHSVEPIGFRRFVTAAGWSRLTRLDISDTRLEEESLVELIRSPSLSSLRELRLGWWGEFHLGSARALVRAPLAQHLESLSLRNPFASADHVNHFSEWPRGKLHRLEITAGELNPGAMLALAQAPGFADLTALHLNGCWTSEEAIGALARWPCLTGLSSLDLGRTLLRGRSLEHLLNSPLGGRLRYLSLNDCHLGEYEARMLARWPGLAGLVALDLAGNLITNDSAQVLARSPHLKGLARLRLTGRHLTDKGRQQLRDVLGPEGAVFRLS
jgi:uncharacterized protein (TIGR02996 family)